MITAGSVRKSKPKPACFYLFQCWVANDWQFPSNVGTFNQNKVIIETSGIFFTIT